MTTLCLYLTTSFLAGVEDDCLLTSFLAGVGRPPSLAMEDVEQLATVDLPGDGPL